MIQVLVDLKTHADSIDPRLWNLLIALLVGGLVYAFKRAKPDVWQRLPSRYKVLPATVIGMLVSGAAGQDIVNMVFEVVFGATSGLMAAGGHEFWDRLLSSPGEDKPPEGDPS